MNEEGLRGVRARRDMTLHQVAVKLPKVMAITLKEWNKTSEVCLEAPSPACGYSSSHALPFADEANADMTQAEGGHDKVAAPARSSWACLCLMPTRTTAQHQAMSSA